MPVRAGVAGEVNCAGIPTCQRVVKNTAKCQCSKEYVSVVKNTEVNCTGIPTCQRVVKNTAKCQCSKEYVKMSVQYHAQQTVVIFEFPRSLLHWHWIPTFFTTLTLNSHVLYYTDIANCCNLWIPTFFTTLTFCWILWIQLLFNYTATDVLLYSLNSHVLYYTDILLDFLNSHSSAE